MKALLASPAHYADLLRSDSLVDHRYEVSGTAAEKSRVGNLVVDGDPMPVYMKTSLLPKGVSSSDVEEERLKLALSMLDGPGPEADAVEYWKARIELMGWSEWEAHHYPHSLGTVISVWRPGHRDLLYRYNYSDLAAIEGYHDRYLRQLAYAIWREWAPRFLHLKGDDNG